MKMLNIILVLLFVLFFILMFFNYKYQKTQVELLEKNKKILELNIKIMNIAKLIFKSDEQLNILLPQASDYKNTNYFPQE
ncbi:hypothetical protein B7K40_06760, partial [Campylobacter jejuni]|nr:hypothetical protein [Campylobacter jejuni]